MEDNFGKYIVKKLLIYIKDKDLLVKFHDIIDLNFERLYKTYNGKMALSDYIEGLPECKGLLKLKQKFIEQKIESDVSQVDFDFFIEQKLYLNSVDQYWLYANWDSISQEVKDLLSKEIETNFDYLLATKISGILLFCKIFDSLELRGKTKMLKK